VARRPRRRRWPPATVQTDNFVNPVPGAIQGVHHIINRPRHRRSSGDGHGRADTPRLSPLTSTGAVPTFQVEIGNKTYTAVAGVPRHRLLPEVALSAVARIPASSLTAMAS